MAQQVKLRRSSVAGNKPTTSQLELGELAINTNDGKLYFEKSSSLGESIQELVVTDAWNTGSINISGSINVSGSINATSFTGSLFGTASYARQALSASYYGGSVVSASYAATASYAENINISGSINNVNYIDFNTGSATPAWKSGRVFWDNTDGALAVYNAEQDITLQVGQENWVRVFNASGVLITDGTPVKLVGSHGDVPEIQLAQSVRISGSIEKSNQILGLATHDIEINTIGYVTVEGVVRGLNTNAFSDGDRLFVSSSAGKITNIPPPAPYEVIPVGIVVKAGPGGSGIIYVSTQQPIDFSDLSSVLVSGSYHYGDLWVYRPSGSTGVWEHTNQLSGSYSVTGSWSATSFTGSLLGTASYVLNAVSSSYAATASYASNAGQLNGLTSASFAPSSGSNSYIQNQTTLIQTGSYKISGTGFYYKEIPGSAIKVQHLLEGDTIDLIDISTYTGDVDEVGKIRVNTYNGNEKVSLDGQTGIYIQDLNELEASSDYLTTWNSSTGYLGAVDKTTFIAASASYVLNAVSSSYAATASYAPLYLPLTGGTINGDVTVNGTASITYLNVQYETASVIYSSGSNQLGDDTSDTQLLIGTTKVSGSLQVTGSATFSSSVTATSLIKSGSSDSFFLLGGGGTVATSSYVYSSSISGTSGTIPLFGASNTLGDSIITQISGGLNIGQTGANYSAINTGTKSTIGLPAVTNVNLALGVNGAGSLGSIIQSRDNVSAWYLSLNPFGGSIITANATDTNEHFIIGGSARVNGTSYLGGTTTIYGGNLNVGQDWASAIYSNTARNIKLECNGNTSGYFVQAAYNSATTVNTTFARQYIDAATSGNLIFQIGNGNFTVSDGNPSSYINWLTVASTGAATFSNSVTATSFTGSFSGSAAAPGSTTQVVFNNGGTISGASGLVYSGSSVGIGVASPLSKLHVDGTVRTVLASGAGGQTLISAINGVSNGYLIDVDASNNITHNWHTGANASSLYINSSGNVGIGTTNPLSKLQVSAGRSYFFSGDSYSVGLAQTAAQGNYMFLGTAADGTFYISETGGTARVTVQQGGNVGIGTSSPNSTFQVSKGGVTFQVTDTNKTASNSFSVYGLSQTSWAIATGNSGSFSGGEKIVITDSGNIGIGTTSPSYLLDIVSSNPRLRIKDSGTGYSILDIEGGAGSFYIATDNSAGSYFGSAYGRYLYSTGAYPMIFVTNASERMRISSGGNLYIGHTDDYGARFSVKQPSSGNAANFSNGSDADLNIEITATGAATKYAKLSPSVAIPLVLATTAGSNVGIGTTTPGAKLDVQGTSYLASQVLINGTTNSSTSYMYDSSGGDNPSYYQAPPALIRLDSSASGSLGQAPVALFIHNESGVDNSWTKLSLGSREAAGSGNSVSVAGIAAQKTSGTNNYWASGDLYLWTKNGSAQVANMVLKPSGYVGIGTTNPNNTLQVVGGVTATSFTGSFSGTIAGYLPLAGGTLTGALQINTSVAGLVLNRPSVTTYTGTSLLTGGTGQWFVGMRENLSSNNHIHYSEYLAADVLTLNVTTGAATFSSTITSQGNITITNAAVAYPELNINGTSGGTINLMQNGTVRGLMYGNAGSFSLSAQGALSLDLYTNGIIRQSISSTGAASFSSTITAADDIRVLSGNVFALNRPDNGASSEIYTNVSNGLILSTAIGTTMTLGTNTTFNNKVVSMAGSYISGSSNSDWSFKVDNQGTTDAHGLYVNIGGASTGVPFRVDKNNASLFNIANSGAATFASTINSQQHTIVSGHNLTMTAGDIQFVSNAGYGILSADTSRLIAIQNGLVGVAGNVDIVGTLTATVKSFVIDHPTKADKKLQYGVLEGPEHSVYIRGRLKNTKYITLPDYWHTLVHEDSITVNITAIGGNQDIWVEQVTEHEITVGYEGDTVEYFYTVFAERKDVDKLITEFDKEI
jgi:hypothetical protein